MLYSNQKLEDIIFRSELEALSQEHPDRLRVVHTLTRETNASACGPSVRLGRIRMDDPKAYTRPWTVQVKQRIMLDIELIQFICIDKDAPHHVAENRSLKTEAQISERVSVIARIPQAR
jgi:ferredoxin-NADP reductase